MSNTVLEPLWLSFARWVPITTFLPYYYCPPKNISLLLSPFASPFHSHHFYHFITKYTHYLPFYTSAAPQLYSSLPCSLSPLIFAFCTIYGCPPATSTSPNLYLSYSNVTQFTPTHGWPIPTPCPCLPPLPPFSLFCLIYAYFPTTRFFPHPSPIYDIVSLCSPPPGWPI